MVQRYPITVRLIGVMHKEKTKMYMTSVLWSDHNDIVVYRGSKDFKKLHKQMKKAFPPANPLKRSDRIIPKFQEKKGKEKKGPSKSVVRLKLLEKYCNDLLSCDARMPQNPEIIRFFLPTEQDLQPGFAKNSIVIMPSEDSEELSAGNQKTVNNVTQPFVTETYRCMAAYDTKDTNNRPFKVADGERLDVLIKDKTGWWLVENDDKRLAWFPAPYLEKIEDDEDENDGPGTDEQSGMYCAARNYQATKADEVSLDIGSVVEVLQQSNNGWWYVRYKGKAGYVPTMYLQPYNNPRMRLHQNLNRSNLNLASLQPPGQSLTGHSIELSRSQGNLLQKYKSRSLDILSEPSPLGPQPEPGAGVNLASPRTFTMEGKVDGDRRGRSLTEGSSDLSPTSTLGSGDSDSSFSDISSSSASDGSSLNLSRRYMDERLDLSRTPPPMVRDRLSPDRRMMAGARRSSEPVVKVSAIPQVPPRPQTHEILARCTTVTRKKAAMMKRSLAAAEIPSH